MQSTPTLRRWLSAVSTVAVLGLVVGFLFLQQPDASTAGGKKDKEAAKTKQVLWGGSVQRNLVNLTEKGIATDWAVPVNIKKDKGRNIKWWVQLGTKAYGGPIIADGKVFVGTNNKFPREKAVKGDKGILMCFDAANGNFLWQSVHDKLPIGRVQDWPEEGVCSSPVVEGDRLWYCSNRCEVICASTGGLAAGNRGVTDEKYKSKTDADIIWRLDMRAQFRVFPHNLTTCSPLIVGDTLFVITANGVDEGHINIPEPNAPSFLAIDKNTGKVIWKSNLPGRKIMHGQWANPVYAEPKGRPMIIFPAGDGFLYSLNPANGELIWKFDCNPKESVYRLGPKGTRNDFVNTPVVWEDKLYIGVGQDPEHKKSVGHLWCIDITRVPKNKDRDISPVSPKGEGPSNFDPRDPRNKDSGLVWHYGGFAPEKHSREYYFGRTLSTCAVHEGLCYACDFDGVFHCFDARTGKLHWEEELGADTWSSPYVVDGHVYIGNERGEVHIFRHGNKKDLVRKVSMGRTARVRATPVAVDGVLYVMTENPCRLYAIAAPKGR